MSQVSVIIAGKTYRIACADGEEEHLGGLAASLDAKIEDMRVAFGEIGEMRLHVMAAITMADELHETRKRIAAMEAELNELRSFASTGDERSQMIEARLADGIQKAADRIERLARGLNAPA
ncbi:cell division protein ZapA [Microvirga brassicacearum]|uniref:Cell division protein ZapA n=1 Tax=Microvirga brassicacearum TaxID=2580413 RepID=A0A5N3PGV7_9HYPH|nr:cell division protein ZapA [Microvirga brassicacearum]KAB0268972.1 cell division protein ZapA [Microvirga brassicacearum]